MGVPGEGVPMAKSKVDSLLNFKSFFLLDGWGKLLSFWGSGRDGGKGHLLGRRRLALKQFGTVVAGSADLFGRSAALGRGR